MEPTIGVPVTFTVFQELCKFLDGSTVSEELAAVASKAITAWIAQQSAPPKMTRLLFWAGISGISRGSKMAARAVIARVAVAAVRPSVLGI